MNFFLDTKRTIRINVRSRHQVEIKLKLDWTLFIVKKKKKQNTRV